MIIKLGYCKKTLSPDTEKSIKGMSVEHDCEIHGPLTIKFKNVNEIGEFMGTLSKTIQDGDNTLTLWNKQVTHEGFDAREFEDSLRESEMVKVRPKVGGAPKAMKMAKKKSAKKKAKKKEVKK